MNSDAELAVPLTIGPMRRALNTPVSSDVNSNYTTGTVQCSTTCRLFLYLRIASVRRRQSHDLPPLLPSNNNNGGSWHLNVADTKVQLVYLMALVSSSGDARPDPDHAKEAVAQTHLHLQA